MRRVLLAGMACMLVAGGCSLGDEAERDRRAEAAAVRECRETGLVTEARAGSGPAPPPIYWDRPFGPRGRTLDSFEAAARALSFRPLPPDPLDPCEIIVSEERPHFLGMRFQHPDFGIFHVSQRELQVPAAGIERRQRALPKSCPRQPGCTPTFSLVQLADGRDALLALGRDETWLSNHAISFVDRERAIEVVIQGPPRTFHRADAIAVANAFVTG